MSSSIGTVTAGRRYFFALLLLLSGFCGISYEVLYARILSNFIGDQFSVSASVLMTFLLGIGFGTLYAHIFQRHLWFIELLIGLYGAAFALLAGTIDDVLYRQLHFSGSPAQSMLLCFLLLSVPAFLIGCSLPLFAGFLSRMQSDRVFAKAYTVYNFGAALTVLAIEFWLLRGLGIQRTVLMMASLNFFIAASLRIGFRDPEFSAKKWTDTSPWEARPMLALALASVASAIFQLLMVKIAECFLGPFRENFALVLALILAGIALGSALVQRYRFSFTSALITAAAGLVWLLGGFGVVMRIYAAVYPVFSGTYLGFVLFKFFVLLVLMGPPALAFGATIPALLKERENVARESGRLLFVSSIANALGFLLMAFVLHPRFDYWILILVIAALTAVALWIHLGVRHRSSVIAFLLLAAAVLFAKTRWDENLLYLGHTSFHSTNDLNEARQDIKFPEKFKGYQDVFSLTRTENNVQFFINGFISFNLNSPAEKVCGAFAALFAPRTDRALVLGLGSGATGGTIALLFDRVDAVEINPVVLKNLYRMAEWNFDLAARPQLHATLDDAIHYTKTSAEQYSLIHSSVTTPLYFSSSKLYTHDFFQTVRNRLTPDGVYITWVDSRVGERGLDIILKTLHQSFAHCWLGGIKASYFLLICSPQEIQLHDPARISNNKILADYLFKENELHPDWLPYGLLSTDAFSLIKDKDVPLNTLDYPALEFEMARLRTRNISQFKARLRENMQPEAIARALQPVVPFDAGRLLVHSELLFGDSTITDRWDDVLSKEIPGFIEKYNAAKLEHGKAFATATNSAEAHEKLGSEFMRQKLFAEAISEFETALTIDPASSDAAEKLEESREQLGGAKTP
jgi:predicted membrane-bound spermidine synthase